jgi:hypothetical protein
VPWGYATEYPRSQCGEQFDPVICDDIDSPIRDNVMILPFFLSFMYSQSFLISHFH